VTLCFSPLQAVMAAKAGATYISPFVGRLDDVGHDGMDIVQQILEIFTNYDFDTEVLVASVRSPTHVLDALRMGADVATVPLKIIHQLIKHPLTDLGLARFVADAAKIPRGKR
jgi:transaldolase